jgi:glycerophosphoryl diester phosphodiesterase
MLIRRHVIKGLAAAGLITAAGSAQGQVGKPGGGKRVEVFGHRGCSALRPEHTLASYAKAIADGADYVEPDLVSTKDGVLVARHENDMSQTTNVASHPEFADRKTTKTIDGEASTGWFVSDFTLAELKTLRAVERLPQVRPQNALYDGQFQIPTFEEMIDFVAAEAATRGRPIGIVPELKHSTYFASIGLPLEDRFLSILEAHDYTRRNPLEIQSFEISNLKYLRQKLGRRSNIRLMQLVDQPDQQPGDVLANGGSLTYRQMTSPEGLKQIAAYADVVAPEVRAIIPLRPDGRLGQPTSLVRDAHAAGLLVHIWTFRPENQFLAADFRDQRGENARNESGSVAEMRRYLAEGIDGFFSDDPGLGRTALAPV